MFNPHHVVETGLTVTRTKPYHPPYRFGIAWSLIFFCVTTGALHKKSWAVIDRPYSLGCATVGALYERPRCIFLCKAVSTGDRIIPGKLKCHENLDLMVECMIYPAVRATTTSYNFWYARTLSTV